MYGHGPSCSSSCCCRSCCSQFLRWKQTARSAHTTATEYSARLRRNSERRLGYQRYSLLASRQDSFTTCSIEASIECRTRKCARQRVASLATPAGSRHVKWCGVSPSFSSARSPLFLRCTLRLELRRRDKRSQKPSTRRDLFTELNGRSRDWQVKASF